MKKYWKKTVIGQIRATFEYRQNNPAAIVRTDKLINVKDPLSH